MGRWLDSFRASEKIVDDRPQRTDKTDKTTFKRFCQFCQFRRRPFRNISRRSDAVSSSLDAAVGDVARPCLRIQVIRLRRHSSWAHSNYAPVARE
jgi:hypothetical protein